MPPDDPKDDPIQYAASVVGEDPMARFLGIEVVKVAENYARLRLSMRPELLNAMGRGHGMVLSALADQSVAVAANTGGDTALVVELTVSFIAGVGPDETLTATATAISRKRRLSFWDVDIRDAIDHQVATARAITYHRPADRTPNST